MTSLTAIDPKTLKRRLDEGSVVLIDIREPAEHARERIAGARLVPLSAIADHEFTGDKAVVFHCRTGNRTAANAGALLARNCPEAYALAGGLEAWKAAGLPTEIDRRAPIEMFRQVQIAAGSLVLAGLVLALLVSPWFAALSAFVGAGLVFAGISGTCGMARLLGIMPWNRSPAASDSARA
jgi:rhodanese-related sulfurtransferase